MQLQTEGGDCEGPHRGGGRSQWGVAQPYLRRFISHEGREVGRVLVVTHLLA